MSIGLAIDVLVKAMVVGFSLYPIVRPDSVTIVDGGTQHRREALDLAKSVGWAKTYDTEYVALTRRLSCALLTTDARLERGAERLVTILRPMSLTEPT